MQILRKGEVGFGSTEFIIFRSKTLIPEFVYFLSRNQSFRQNAINSMVGASGRQRVDNKCFNSFMFLHPPQSILGQFSDLTNPMVRQIFKLNAQNQTLRRTRDLLLPRLISGQLSVAEAETALNA
jgi:type I restriction enzyme S subunit